LKILVSNKKRSILEGTLFNVELLLKILSKALNLIQEESECIEPRVD
jgi:hypothetical protein